MHNVCVGQVRFENIYLFIIRVMIHRIVQRGNKVFWIAHKQFF